MRHQGLAHLCRRGRVHGPVGAACSLRAVETLHQRHRIGRQHRRGQRAVVQMIGIVDQRKLRIAVRRSHVQDVRLGRVRCAATQRLMEQAHQVAVRRGRAMMDHGKRHLHARYSAVSGLSSANSPSRPAPRMKAHSIRLPHNRPQGSVGAMVRLSISTLACPNWSLPQIVGAASAHGVQGLDLRGIGPEIDVTKLDLFDTEIDSTIELLRQHSVQVPCINTSIALVTTAAERWEMMLNECQRVRAACGQIEDTVPAHLRRGGAQGDDVASKQLHWLGGVLDSSRNCAATHNCQVLLETHDDWATSGEVRELLSDFPPEQIGVLWDIEHPYRRGEHPSDTASLAKYIRHVHIKDSVRDSGPSIPRLLGEGELPLEDVIKALRRIGYDGWICLETEKRWHPQAAPEPEESLPQFASWMRSTGHRRVGLGPPEHASVGSGPPYADGFSRLSRMNVAGPSFVNETFMSAPNSPVAVGTFPSRISSTSSLKNF